MGDEVEEGLAAVGHRLETTFDGVGQIKGDDQAVIRHVAVSRRCKWCALVAGVGAFVKGIGKFPLECKSSPGFVVNRILAPYMSEAMHLVQEGVGLPDIDEAAAAFGMPIGPVELVDSVGLDVALSVSKVLGAAYDRPLPAKLTEMVEAKQLGRKTGTGFYQWVDGKPNKPAGGGPVPDV